MSERKLILCIAVSLDGYIADTIGSVDFLFEKPRLEPDAEYQAFYEEVDTILMGSRTYRQMVETICPDRWMYADKTCYVFSRNTAGKGNGAVRFTAHTPAALLEELRGENGGSIWLYGGNSLIHSFLRDDLIDEMFLYHIPVLLGSGVPLFNPGFRRKDLTLLSFSKVDEIVKVRYRVQRAFPRP